MVATTLVDRDIAAGAQLLRAMDAAGMSVVAAFWLLEQDTSDWVLTFAVPQVDTDGPFEVYLRINEIVARLQPPTHLQADDIRLVETHDPLVIELQVHRGTDPHPYIGGVAIERQAVGDVYVAGAYIYRAERFIGQDLDLPIEFAVRNPTTRRWSAVAGRLVFRGGLLVQLDTPNGIVPHRRGRAGITAEFRTIQSTEVWNGVPRATVRRWTVRNGRLWGAAIEPDPISLDPPPSTAVTPSPAPA